MYSDSLTPFSVSNSSFLSAAGPTSAIDILQRHQVRVIGVDKPTLLFCNGMGCSQHTWQYITSALATRYQLVLFDQIGSNGTNLESYDSAKYCTLAGYAQDVVTICQALGLREVTLVGHSVGGMIALLAVRQAPAYFTKTILLAFSPCYFNQLGYYGGMDHADLLALLALMDTEYQGWTHLLTEFLSGPAASTTLGETLLSDFCQLDSKIAKQFIRVALLTDMRTELPYLRLPTLLIQGSQDVITPSEIQTYLLAQLPSATVVSLSNAGHFPQLSAPLETLAAIEHFLAV
jgi:sigma-B regulation protein RsbQ